MKPHRITAYCIICEEPCDNSRKICSKECSREYQKAYMKAYKKTDKYKAYQKAYYLKSRKEE